MRLDNPLLVRWEYASEERLENRNAVLRALSRGPSPEDASVATVAPLQPKRLLDVGCGLGELGERFQNELGAHVCAIDTHVGGVVLADGRRDECTVRSQHTRALGERALEIRDVVQHPPGEDAVEVAVGVRQLLDVGERIEAASLRQLHHPGRDGS